MFIDKLPCLVPRIVDKTLWPPSGAHNITDYPVYYDPLYHPHEYNSVFDSPFNFCPWLKIALSSHHLQCVNCNLEFTGSISFDGISITIFYAPDRLSVAKPPLYFAEAEYTHCRLLRDIESHRLLSRPTVASCMSHVLTNFPPWFFYSDEIYDQNLSCLTANSLAASVSSLSLMKGLFSMLQDIDLPPTTVRHAVPLISAYFERLYGPDVAAALRKPPNPELVRRLHSLSLDTLAYCIQRLVPGGRLSFNSRSRRRTSTGLINHILGRVRYLESVGADILCNIFLAYDPLCTSLDRSDGDYIFQILEHEYGGEIIKKLTTTARSNVAEQYKIARREKKLERVNDAREAAEAYDRSKWTEPPVCAVCGQYQRVVEEYDIVSNSNGLDVEKLRSQDEFVIEKHYPG